MLFTSKGKISSRQHKYLIVFRRYTFSFYFPIDYNGTYSSMVVNGILMTWPYQVILSQLFHPLELELFRAREGWGRGER